MAARTRHQTSPKTEPTRAHVFDAGQFATLAVHENLKLAADRRAFQTHFHEGVRLARNLLSRDGLGRSLAGDPQQGALDAMQDLCEKLRRAESRASSATPVNNATMRQLLARIAALTAEASKPEGEAATEEPDDQEALERFSSSPGAHLLAAMKELSTRLLQSTPDSFELQVYPWTSVKVASTVTMGRQRLATYTTAVLLNLCRSQIRAARKAKAECYSDLHQEAGETYQRKRTSVVMSPHLRSVVVLACNQALQSLKASPSDEKLVQDLPFIEAAIKVLPLLLDAPDQSHYTLARLVLEQEGTYTDQEIHRGLAAAKRHVVFQQVCNRIEKGGQWRH